MRGGRYVDELQVRLFQREGQALARLKHPSIAAIYEAGRTDNGEHFFAMEMVRGRPLMEHVRQASLSIPERLQLFRTICDAINYAHQRGVMHRDLKPSNILINADGHPKILDFGLAKITESDLSVTTLVTEVGQIQGTLPYMSPEQARGDADTIDVRTDVYSLGVIAYEMLTDSLPYDVNKGMLHEAVRVICEEEPKRPSTISRALRGDLETIVLKALEKEPNRRYQSAAALSNDFDRYLTNQPILARPPSAIYQLRKLVARHRAPFVFVGVLFVMLAGFSIWMSVLYSRAEALRVAAEKAQTEAHSRAEELGLVTEFQASMLGDIDAVEMGRALYENIEERLRAAIEEEGIPPQEMESTLAAFGRTLRRTNSTSIALELIDKQVLHRAALAIEEEFSEKPLIRAALEQTVGDIYRDIGLYSEAAPLHESALTTRRQLLGEEHLETLRSVRATGLLLREMGKFEEAHSYFSEAVEVQRRSLGDDHPETLESIKHIGFLLWIMDDYEEALLYSREALDGESRVYGDDHPFTLQTLGHVGTVLWSLGKLEEAEPYFREALEGQRRVLGNDDPSTLTAINNMGQLLRSLGKREEALIYLHESLAGDRGVNGDDHPLTLTSINNVGTLLVHMGRLEEAEGYLREAMEGRRRMLGADHPETLRSINNMGFLFGAMGEPDEALGYYNEALAGYREVLGNDHPNTLSAIKNMGALYLQKDRPDQAIAILEPAEAEARQTFVGDFAHFLATILTTLGRSRSAIGSFKSAESDLLEAHAIYGEAPGTTAKNEKEILTGLAELYEDWQAADPGKGYDQQAAEWHKKLSEL